jgi:transcriptional regulator with XRE-family HTH domain
MPSTNRVDSASLAFQMAKEAAQIGGRIRELREEKGLSQRSLADLLPGSTQGTDVSRWERGQHVPNTGTLEHIAEVLDTSIADLRSGPRPERGPTPDVLGKLDGGSSQLDQIEETLEELVQSMATLAAAVAELQPTSTPTKQHPKRTAGS